MWYRFEFSNWKFDEQFRTLPASDIQSATPCLRGGKTEATPQFSPHFFSRENGTTFFSVVVSPDESDLSSEDRAINLAWSGSKRWLTQTSSSLLTVLQTNQAKHPRPQYSYRKCPRCLPFLTIRSQQPDDHSRSLDDNHSLISIPLAAEILTTTSCSVYQLELRSSKKVIDWDQARARIAPTIPYDRRKRRICEGAKEKANIHISLLVPSQPISHSLSLRCDKCSLECAAPARNVKIRLVALRQARPQPAWQTYWETEGERGNSRESRITVEDVNGRRWMSCGSELEWKTRKHRVGSGKLKVRSRCDRRGTGWFVGWKMMLYGLIFFTIRKMQI